MNRKPALQGFTTYTPIQSTGTLCKAIAEAWTRSGYGPFTELSDKTYLLFHKFAVDSFWYHIHIGNETSGIGQFITEKKGEGIRGYELRNQNFNEYTPEQWANHIWVSTGYSQYTQPQPKAQPRPQQPQQQPQQQQPQQQIELSSWQSWKNKNNYRKKYLKYKNKYINLKNSI